MALRVIKRTVAALLLFLAGTARGQPAVVPIVFDDDADGLPDRFEQDLLERFAPSFFVSAVDCDVMPAEFVPDSPAPRLVARNGTIYGQVFRRPWLAAPGRFIEIHYFHLWTRDCGRGGHPLDAENVSVLLRADQGDSPATDWTAIYWYAGAHEGTLCDVSSAAKASELGATDHGPNVWISNGKLASFFVQRQCALGCGGDRCENVTELKLRRIVNIGETDAPLNGAVWVKSRHWNLSAKMATDFDDRVLAQLSDPEAADVIRLRTRVASAQAVIRSGASTLDSLDGGRRTTATNLYESGQRTDHAIERSSANVEASLSRAADAVAKSVRSSVGSAAKVLWSKQK
jgi:hypothetical protein